MIDSIKKLKDIHDAPTPLKWRKLGKSIGLLGTSLQVAIAGLQSSDTIVLPGSYFGWVIGIALIQWLGQTITDFATEDA